jgi:peroxiredoxin
MMRDRVLPDQIHNFAHNNEWLIRDLSYVGRVRDAIDLAKNMIELPRHPKYNQATNRGSGAEHGRTRLIDVLSQHEMWDEYLELCDSVYLQDEPDREQQIRKLRYKGVAQAALKKTADAKATLAVLEKQRTVVKPEAPATRPATRPTTAPSTQPSQSRRGPRGGGGGGNDKKDDPNANIDKAIAHIKGQLAASAGDFKTAIDLFGKAQVRKEQIARLQLAAGNKSKAEELARQVVDDKKSEAYPLANLVLVLNGCGKTDEAKKSFEKLRKLSGRIDITSPPYRDLTPIAKELGFPEEWVLPHDFAKDTGTRPSLDKLGPFRWHPSPAPAFSVTDADGHQVTHDQYRGKPVVVVFYLGHSCLHCTRQLQAFAPKIKDFAAAGITVLGISTDTPEALHKAWDGYKLDGDGTFPFPLASDSKLEIFKRYNCHDDFEKAPLHGTFLIDGHGLIRWQDIGPDPFTDVNFLLTESKRLLAQPTPASH